MLERLRSSRVLLQERDNLVIAPAELHIANGRITRVERLDQATPAEPTLAGGQLQRLDVGERLVTPAFVNAHTHLALAFLRGVDAAQFQQNLVEDLYFRFESRLTPADVRAFSRMGAYESLLAGVGCVWDHYYGEQAVADALLDTGLSGVVAPTVQDLAGPGVGGAEDALAATLQIANSPEYAARGVFAALGPHATDTVSPAMLRRVAELADGHRLPVHMHLAQSCDEVARVEAREGRTPLELLLREGVLEGAPSLVLAHAIYVARRELALLDPARHTLVFCPSSQLQFGYPADVSLWNASGVAWVVATDCASSNDSMNLQKELRWCLGAAAATITGSPEHADFLAHGGAERARRVWDRRSERVFRDAPHVRSDTLLQRICSMPGALHPAFRAGVIEAGALANLAVWDTEHPAFWPARDLVRALALSDTTQAIHTLLVCGTPIGRVGALAEGVLTSDAYREARREANERLAHLLSS